MKIGPIVFGVLLAIVAGVFIDRWVFNQTQRIITEESGPAENEQKKEAPNNQQPQSGKITVSIGDAPFLGEKSAGKVAILEFSDFECPYCSKFHRETYDKIISDYIDTGKAVFAYRNLPLSFHQPAAGDEAFAVSCAREQKDDKAYFDLAKLIYTNTQGNGKGIENKKMLELVDQLGIDKTKFTECMDSGKYKEYVEKDIADADKVGITGTPAFVIGKINDKGEVVGNLLGGAYPFSEFKKLIDGELGS